jgi:hypothetical protein
MAFGGPARPLVSAINSGVTALTRVPVLGPVMRKSFTEISYTGRKSGTRFTLPVNYRRRGDTVTIWVGMADQKNWWRNFLGAGAPLTVHLPDGDRSGLGVAARDAKGRVSVTVTLDPL